MIQIGTYVTVACNSEAGVNKAKVIGVYRKNSTKKRLRRAEPGDQVLVTLRSGPKGVKGTMRHAAVIRTRRVYKRTDGRNVCFQDNAVAILADKMFRGTSIKGVCAVEATRHFPTLVGKGASIR